MNDAEALRMGRALIADPAHWTRKVWARNKRGEQVRPESPNATQFCALGALCHVSADGDIGLAADALAYAARELYGRSLVEVNDHMAHVDVLLVYDRAINLAEIGA